ncbi:MAG: methyltransferase domain-containing protein [Planctomycetota bacterium]
MGTEREIKIALGSAEDHAKLAAALPSFIGEELQENSYWDSPDRRLTAAGIMLRLRIEGEAAVVTIKGQATKSADGLFQAAEHEDSIELSVAHQVNAGQLALEAVQHPLVAGLLAAHEIVSLERWGTMRNRRRRYQLPDGWVAELDETHYPDGSVDWEVELEGEDPEAGRHFIQQALDGQPIAHRPQTSSKSQRLRNRLQGAACEAFGEHSDDYERYRPQYPAAVWDFLQQTLAPLERPRVADLGAGTGKGSIELVRRGFEVTAVEPDPRMRAAGDAACQAAGARVWWQPGTAEATGLPDDSCDLVVAAQAFHWFDVDATFRELRRILTATGRVAIWWNERQVAGCAWLEEFEQLVQQHNPAYTPDYRSRDWLAILREGGLSDVAEHWFAHEQQSSEEHFLGFVRTISYIRGVLDDSGFDAFNQELTALLRRHHGNQPFTVPYKTGLFTGLVAV